ncbi:MAG: hypothetical protein KBT22_05435 [Bacteroidales bacterium]|nr:hypothetical protein [Candidatus Scybalocola fimicaballi]
MKINETIETGQPNESYKKIEDLSESQKNLIKEANIPSEEWGKLNSEEQKQVVNEAKARLKDANVDLRNTDFEKIFSPELAKALKEISETSDPRDISNDSHKASEIKQLKENLERGIKQIEDLEKESKESTEKKKVEEIKENINDFKEIIVESIKAFKEILVESKEALKELKPLLPILISILKSIENQDLIVPEMIKLFEGYLESNDQKK